MADYLYIAKTIEDDKIQLATKVEIVDGIMLCEGKICAVLKRYALPVDMTEVMADLQRFSAGKAAAPQVLAVPQPEPKPAQKEPEPTPPPAKPAFTKKPLQKQNNQPKVKTLSDAFFGDCREILADRYGNSPDVREEAMERIEKIMLSAAPHKPGAEVTFAGNVRCPEEGHLSLFCYKTKGGTCYDGGCYSSEPGEEKYCYFTRVTSVEFYREQDENEEWGKYWQNYWVSTWHTLQDKLTDEVFMESRNCLYMQNPLGVLGFFKLEC